MKHLLTITLVSVSVFCSAMELHTQNQATFAATQLSSGPTDRPVEESLHQECTAGVADGDVTFDGRPLLWKLRNESDVTNDVHYFASGMEHYPGIGAATYSYLGMGPANDSPEGPVRQGLNSQGLAVGWNVLGSSGWQELHHQALGHYNTVSQVRTYVNGMTNLSTYNYFIDTGGEAALWENQTGTGQHWEYNTRATARDSQWIDADNADGDYDYSTGVDVTLSGWVVRANTPGHFNTDGTDDLYNTGRYQVGRDITGNLIYNGDQGSALSAKSLASSFFRDDTLARYDTVSNMIIHGVLPTEDPRLSTMWTLLGHSETGIFVPVWIHGVESGGANRVPQYLDSSDDGVSVYAAAKGMHNAGFNEANVQARTLPFEAHLFDVVNDKLLPDWRGRDWTDSAAVTVVGEEMKRVQEQMDADAYTHLKYLRDNGSASNYAPTVSIDSATHNGSEVTFSVTGFDADGSELTYLFNYGDGQIGSSQTHDYAQPGHYLVSCTVTDENGVSQTDWLFVTVTQSPPLCNDAHEPNDATGEATPIGNGTTLSDLDICPAADVDYYAFNGSAGDTIVADIDAEVIGSSLDSHLYLYDADGVELTHNDAWDGLDSHIQYVLPTDGTYSLMVREHNHPYEGGADYYYTLYLNTISPPGPATPVSPEGLIEDTMPTYTWEELAEATWYKLYVQDLMSRAEVYSGWYPAAGNCEASTCSVTPSVTLDDGPYRWLMQTYNEDGRGPWSDSLDFVVNECIAPGAASLLEPSGEHVSPTPEYIWEPVSGATWYKLWVDGPSGNAVGEWHPSAEVCTETECSLTPAVTLEPGLHIGWVKTWNPCGGAWSDRKLFVVGPFEPPEATTLVAPSGTIDDNTPLYEWDMVEAATHYWLVVDGPEGRVIGAWHSSSAVCDAGVGQCAVAPDTILADGDYTWWVRTWNRWPEPEGTYGEWSAPLNFTVSTGSPTAASRSAGEHRLYLPLILKSAGPDETPPPPSSQPPPDDDSKLTPPLDVDAPATSRALFKPASPPEDVETRDEPSILRTRFVEVNWAALAGSGGPPGNQLGTGSPLRLELFEDVTLTAVLDRAEAHPPDGLIWVGHIEGVADSQVGLVVEGDRMRGDISLPDAAYQVRPVGDGVHAIYEINLPSGMEPAGDGPPP